MLGPRRTPLRIPAAGPSAPAPTAVVHLIRAANGIEPFASFLSSWRRCPPGAEFELVLAMKGFEGEEGSAPYLELARDLHPRVVMLPDEGLDLGSYFAVAAQLRRERYCFLNSFCELLAPDWLAKLEHALDEPGTGMVGATGSWASTHSWVTYVLRLPSPYRKLFPSRELARRAMLEIDLERAGVPARSRGASLAAKLRLLPTIPEQLVAFAPFPAYHLRTNAFMITHGTLARLRLHGIAQKMDAYVLESGRASITRQVQRLGLATLVVDRDGETFPHPRWDRSRTLWQGGQEGLLVADNQTRSYERGGDERRQMLSTFAWGPAADPALGGGGTAE